MLQGELEEIVIMLQIQKKRFNQLPQTEQISSKWWATIGVGIGVFIFALDVYIINLALPIMVESLHTDFTTIQWVILSYLLAIAIFVLSVAKLGDIWSKKQLYIIGLIIFTISSLFCGLSPTISILIACRALQGIGAAFLSGLGTAMIVEAFPPEERGLALGIRAGVFGLGITLGPSLGGLLITLGNWPLIFLINVPIGIIGILIVSYFVPASVVNEQKQSFDLWGTLILTLTLTCFTLGITCLQRGGFNSQIAIILLTLSVISFTGFLIIESRSPQPMLDLKMFQSLEFSLGLWLRFVGNFVMAGVIFMLPFFLELVKEYSTKEAGLLLGIPPILILVSAPVAGLISDRWGARRISLIGLLLMSLGCFLISRFDDDLTISQYIGGIIPYGLGVGMFQSPNNSAIMGTAPKDRIGIASGLLSLSRILGQTIGVPLVGALFSFVTLTHAHLTLDFDVTNAPLTALTFGTQITFLAVSILLLISIVLTVVLRILEKNFAIH